MAEGGGRVAATSHLPCTQTSLGIVRCLARRLAGGVRALGVRGGLCPASPSPLFPSLLLGVPLLFVIPWGIVKYLYEDEG